MKDKGNLATIVNAIFKFISPRIPQHQEVEVKMITDDLLRQGIIKKQQAVGYSSWCSRAMFVPKKPSNLTLVTDYTQLDCYIDRPVHPFPTIAISRGL